MALVDSTFAADVKECMGVWDVREQKLREMRRKRKTPLGEHLKRLGEDLMKPVGNHFHVQPPSRKTCAKREARMRQKILARVREARVAKPSGRWHNSHVGCGDYGGEDDFVVKRCGFIRRGGNDNGPQRHKPYCNSWEHAEENQLMDKDQRRKYRRKQRKAERDVLEMENTAWIEKANRRWKNRDPKGAKLAKLRTTYSKARPL